MANTRLESQVINHMEFLGYDVARAPEADQSGVTILLRAVHPSGAAINVTLYETGARFSIWLQLNDFAMTNTPDLLEAMNDLNRRFDTQHFISNMGEIPAYFHTLVYFGPYEKKAFGHFVRTWETEQQALWATDISEFLV